MESRLALKLVDPLTILGVFVAAGFSLRRNRRTAGATI